MSFKKRGNLKHEQWKICQKNEKGLKKNQIEALTMKYLIVEIKSKVKNTDLKLG